MALHLRSYLAPSVPPALFEAIGRYLGVSLDTAVDVDFDTSSSGPRPDGPEPFSTGEVDLAFLCATSYVWLTSGSRAVELAGAAWVPTDERAGGQPVYFCDVVAPIGGVATLAELRGRHVAYNDRASLSGFHGLRLALGASGIDAGEIRMTHSGSHLRSVDLLRDGAVDAAAIDSNVWRRCVREDPTLAQTLRVVESLGPHPTQPAVVRADLDPRSRRAIFAALLDAHEDGDVAAALADAELTRFAPVEDADYSALRRQVDQIPAGG